MVTTPESAMSDHRVPLNAAMNCCASPAAAKIGNGDDSLLRFFDHIAAEINLLRAQQDGGGHNRREPHSYPHYSEINPSRQAKAYQCGAGNEALQPELTAPLLRFHHRDFAELLERVADLRSIAHHHDRRLP